MVKLRDRLIPVFTALILFFLGGYCHANKEAAIDRNLIEEAAAIEDTSIDNILEAFDETVNLDDLMVEVEDSVEELADDISNSVSDLLTDIGTAFNRAYGRARADYIQWLNKDKQKKFRIRCCKAVGGVRG